MQAQYTIRLRPRLGAAYRVLLLAAGVSESAELRPETAKAWDEYLRTTESNTKTRISGKSPFLWLDEAHRDQIVTPRPQRQSVEIQHALAQGIRQSNPRFDLGR